MDFSGFFSERASSIDTSGIRRIFHLGAHMKDPINLSIGQPDFPVPDAIKRAAIDAIRLCIRAFRPRPATAST